MDMRHELHALRRLLEDGAAIASDWGRADVEERERIVAIPNTSVRRVEARVAELVYADELENRSHLAVRRTLVEANRRLTRILSEAQRDERRAA